MSRFDRFVLATVLGLGLTIGALSVALARLGPTVSGLATATTIDGTLANSQLAVSFNQPMNIRSVERHFRIRPRISGQFSWSGNQMLFIPNKTFAYAQRYSVTIATGARDSSGKPLAHAFRSSFTTQSEHLLYLGSAGAERNRLVLASLDSKRQIIGVNDGLITGYAASPDRSLAVYVKKGAPGERPDELWLLNLTDNSTQRVFRRPDWAISQPHLSPDNRYIVFLATNVRICRQYYGCYRDRTYRLVYFLDLRTHHLFPFRSTSDVPITDYIDFSPQGQIAYTDLGSALVLANPNGTHIVHIPNGVNSPEFVGFDPQGDKAVFVGQTPSSTGGDILVFVGGKYVDASSGIYDSSAPSFSSSGTSVAYSAYRGERAIEPLYGIDTYNLHTHILRRLTDERDWTDWAPAWSLDDHYIAYVRSQPQEAMYLGSGEIWVMRADGRDAHPLGGIGQDITWVS